MKSRILLSWLYVMYLVVFSAAASVKKPGQPVTTSVTIQMPGYTPVRDDDYVCVASARLKSGYILRYEPSADADRVHHLLLYGCVEPLHTDSIWKGVGACRGPSKILYAWARNAPGLEFPTDVGMAVGREEDNINYIIMQVHYATRFNGDVKDYTSVQLYLTEERPKYLAAVYLFVSGKSIPPLLPAYYTNMSCVYRGEAELHPFAFRTHTHMMGRVVSAFFKHDDKWKMIGKRNPQWPQMFQSINESLTISPNDVLAAQCRYDSSNVEHSVAMGSMGANEMCNFYMMYYRDADSPDPFSLAAGICAGQLQHIFDEYPSEGQSLLPERPELVERAHQSAISFGERKRRWMPDANEGYFGGDGFHRRRPPLDQTDDWKWKLNDEQPKITTSLCGDCVVDDFRWKIIGDVPLGQVAGLALTESGDLAIFHRGSRVWGADTFGYSHKLIDQTPIDEDVVLVADVSVDPPKLIKKWGKQKFFLPHGIFVDSSGNYYLTDVGAHQVWKYVPSQEKMTVQLTFGEQFIPGSDQNHFCQPAAVSVAKDGSIFIADGYCNSRIVKYSADGQFVMQWGEKSSGSGLPALGTFSLPHDIILDESRSLIYVADRQNGRLQTFQMDGTPISEIRLPHGVNNLYSIDAINYTVYLMPGESKSIRGFAANTATNLLEYSWAPKSHIFERPHILRLSKDGAFIYVGEISGDGGVLWRFHITKKQKTVQLSHHHDSENSRDTGKRTGKKKPLEASDETKRSHSKQLALFLIISIALCAFLALLIYFCMKFCQMNQTAGSSNYRGKPLLDRNGFKPLSTEDVDAADDLTTDESDQEDTLYSLRTKQQSSRA